VRLFARLAELAGTRQAEVDLGEGLTAGDVFGALARSYPALAGLGETVRFAVNAEYVPASHPVRDGDEVALIPPVSGGAHAV
jgi:molybdopterin converting factor subunit 1